jgi:2-octaprenyl-6-methoxyphenol hydroxylase
VAAQGLNLGLRDADTLLPLLAHARDIGAPALLHRYQRQRQRDRLTITAFTHSLIGLFDHHDPISRLGRGIALSALDMLTPLRQRFTHKLVFGLEY